MKSLLGLGHVRNAKREAGGAVMVEFLIAYLPVLVAFLMFWQLGELIVATMIIERASSAAGRAAVVVLPDDPAFYDGDVKDVYAGNRQRQIKFAAGMILQASPHLSENFTVDVANIPTSDDHIDEITVTVTAEFHCERLLWVCGLTGTKIISAASQHTYQGARYDYEPPDLSTVINTNSSDPSCSGSDTPNAGGKPSAGGGPSNIPKGLGGAGPGHGGNGSGGSGHGGTGSGGKGGNGSGGHSGNGSAGKGGGGGADPSGGCPAGQTLQADNTCAPACPANSGASASCPNNPCPAGQTRDPKSNACACPAPSNGTGNGNNGAVIIAGSNTFPPPNSSCNSCQYQTSGPNALPKGDKCPTNMWFYQGKCLKDTGKRTADGCKKLQKECSPQTKSTAGQSASAAFVDSAADLQLDIDVKPGLTACSDDTCTTSSGTKLGDSIKNAVYLDTFQTQCNKNTTVLVKAENNIGTYSAADQVFIAQWRNYCNKVQSHLVGGATVGDVALSDFTDVTTAGSALVSAYNGLDSSEQGNWNTRLNTGNGAHTEKKIIQFLKDWASNSDNTIQGGSVLINGTLSPCNGCDSDLKALSRKGVEVRYCFSVVYTTGPAATSDKSTFFVSGATPGCAVILPQKACYDYSSGSRSAPRSSDATPKPWSTDATDKLCEKGANSCPK